MKNKILIAEDEKELAKALKAILNHSNYDVEIVYDGRSAINCVKNNNFDLIILDIMMPITDGITALKEIRNIGINTPIMLLTAKSQIDDKVEGLDSGANDYLTKPFDKKELLARVRALIRLNDENNQKYNIGNLLFDMKNSELSNNTMTFHLNNKECEILKVLIKNQKSYISENELNTIIWNSRESVTTNVKMYISYLQNKLRALEANVIINNKNGYILESKL